MYLTATEVWPIGVACRLSFQAAVVLEALRYSNRMSIYIGKLLLASVYRLAKNLTYSLKTSSEDPDTQVTVSITGITTLSDGRKATVVTAAEDDAEGDKGYVPKTTDGLLLVHCKINDLQGELFYTSTIKVGTRWERYRGWEAEVVTREDISTPAGRFQNFV